MVETGIWVMLVGLVLVMTWVSNARAKMDLNEWIQEETEKMRIWQETQLMEEAELHWNEERCDGLADELEELEHARLSSLPPSCTLDTAFRYLEDVLNGDTPEASADEIETATTKLDKDIDATQKKREMASKVLSTYDAQICELLALKRELQEKKKSNVVKLEDWVQKCDKQMGLDTACSDTIDLAEEHPEMIKRVPLPPPAGIADDPNITEAKKLFGGAPLQGDTTDIKLPVRNVLRYIESHGFAQMVEEEGIAGCGIMVTRNEKEAEVFTDLINSGALQVRDRVKVFAATRELNLPEN